MRTLPLVVLTVVLLAAPSSQARGTCAGSDNTRPTGVSAKGVTLSGQVSNDGKTLLADDDNNWIVSSPDALKGLEGRYVTVKCRMNLKQRSILILFVIDAPGMKHAANLGDSAFRR